MLRLATLEQHLAVRGDCDKGPVVDTLNELVVGRLAESMLFAGSGAVTESKLGDGRQLTEPRKAIRSCLRGNDRSDVLRVLSQCSSAGSS